MDPKSIKFIPIEAIQKAEVVQGYFNFSKGTVISIKHPHLLEPALSVIQKTDSENIYFRIPEVFLKNNILKGDTLILQILQESTEYVISGIISDIGLHYPRLVQFHAEKIQKFKNHRKSKRYLASLQANISGADFAKEEYAIIKNISNLGISMNFKHNMELESIIFVSILISKEEFLEFKVRITRSIRKNNYIEYGAEIIKIDEKNKEILNQLILNLQQNEKLFVLECLK